MLVHSLRCTGIWLSPSKPFQSLCVSAYRQDSLLFSCFPPTYQATQEVAGLIFSGPWTLFLPQLRRRECLCEGGPSVFPCLKSELALGPIKQQPKLSHLCLHLRSITVQHYTCFQLTTVGTLSSPGGGNLPIQQFLYEPFPNPATRGFLGPSPSSVL